ncbi:MULTISPECIES: ABC transporter ATP-binding protein [Methylomicrobium]|uniref:ABC-type cobalamin/Fe3+-siderophore transport system, ATPase component n=1 Tax=Methylomicrobium album BG8 TaxID=686340 RepID=H8GIK3_METAL|nr:MULTISPECIES: ABC transporter ATP-binding protein [Methylomicrobium]EIC29030.1 ABC-type cobalamin/Fe3+-siderophore transport system, ATPase component [Methylomicrobium album BG8]
MVLKVEGLVYRYALSHPPVLDAIDLTLAKGEMLCLLGPNGTGKTTLLRCLIGAVRAERGTISIDGKTSATARQRARKMAYVPQAGGESALSLLDTVLMGRTPHLRPLASPSRRDHDMACRALSRVGIEHLARRSFNQVSGGERQLALIARALVQEPGIFLMDEPTASLDLGNQVRVLRTIRSLAADGLSVLFTSHQPEHALLLGARVAVLRDGRIAKFGTAGEVLSADMLSDLYRTPIDIVAMHGVPAACVPRI